LVLAPDEVGMRISTPVGNDLETLFGVGVVGRLSDAELLARFLRREDVASSEAAFAALVERHGSMVLGVCRRMLGDYHAAADAFQAVFLVLAGKAPRVRVDDTLARWLHGVSVRVSLQARAVARAERARVRSLEGLDPIDASAPADPEGRRELRAAIDEEIARLPARYRSAVVLCYLEGLTPEQAARRLRCPVGTVQSRLHRARERLRPALSRRGLAPSAWGPTALTDMIARADVPPALAASAVRVVGPTAGAVPAAVAVLVRSTIRSLSMSRTLRVAWILLAVGVSASGAAILAGVGDDRGANRPAPRGQAAKADTPAERPNPAPAADGRLEIRAIDAATGQPLEGASVSWRLGINHGKHQDKKSTTNGDGLAVLNWAGGATVNGLEVTVRKAGFVSYFINWKDSAHPLHLPAFKEIRLVTGIAIGGVVKDEAGGPVAGARIEVLAPPNETEESNYGFTVAEATTDATGRWRVDHAPASPAGVSVQIRAPRFLETGGPPSRNLDAVTILKRGVTIKGRVLDARRQPIAGAKVRGGDEWASRPAKVKTDAGGAFVLENLKPGASVVTVQAEGFAPDLREVHPEDQPALEFLLGPGHTVRGQVVDRNGKPVAGATIYPETWRAHRTLQFLADTGPDGRFEWRSAPGDVVLYSISKTGYISRGGVALPATGAEQVVTLDPEVVVSGRVIDAATGRPVPAFRLVRGQVFADRPQPAGEGIKANLSALIRGVVSASNPRPHWMPQEAAAFTRGRYTVKFDGPYAGYALRVEAEGYKPADSRVFRPGEVAPTFDFTLNRAEAADLLTGVVLLPDGRPAAGVEVALATPEHPLGFEGGFSGFGRGNGMPVVKTGPDGRFSFARPGGAYLLAAMSDDGYAEAAPEAPRRPDTLRLQPWGKIKGRAGIGHQPAAYQTIAFDRRGVHFAGPRGVHGFYQRETRTDAQGQFSFDRVIPGEGEVSRVVLTEFGDGSGQHMPCWQEPVDIAPGQTVLVRIGARGRPVVGRIALRAVSGVHVDWRRNRPATLRKARSSDPVPDPRPFDQYASNLDKDGRFRIDDVPPGRYELTVTIDPPAVPNRPGPVQEIGQVKVPVEVVQGPDDVPVELGEIKAEVPDRSKK
jgi:RNA polymerase sigma factor (sigma-70 family)